ncbi:MAG: 30S ribosomal protein S16 [Kiritimatiellia bacterium]
MVKIRLRRTGCKNNAAYRVVAADERSPRDGKFLEILGWYEPTREGVNFKLKLDRIAAWQSKGAQMSETVASMVRRAKRAVAAESSDVST